jgi:biopolymer transport protein ExbD
MLDELDDDVRPDLTPLIDVIFMLVIFFVMTMSFSKPVMDIVLPKAEHSEAAKRSAQLELTVTADGVMKHGEEVIEKDALPAFLEREPEAMLNLFVDEKAPFERFIAIVDAAKEKRGGKFIITTGKPEKK